MRLLELEISNVRGIKTTKLNPDGANFVVWGPNGSGKSAVVDAIDFLFTGKISRLIGEGTGGISLKAHGPHVDHKAEDAKVRGLIRIGGYDKPIPIQRSIASPNILEFPAEAGAALKPILDIASKGQLVLSRRQILRFIATEPSKRANEVQALLDLSELEEIRKTFTKAENLAKGESNHADSDLRSAQQVLQLAAGLSQFDEKSLLTKVNELRKILSGEPLTTPSASNLKINLAAPATSGQLQGVNPQLLRTDYTSLTKILEEADEKISKSDQDLRTLLGEIRSNAATLQGLKKLQLLKLGVTLIEENGACPLCEKEWPKGELAKHLAQHIAETEAIAEKTKDVDKLASKLVTQLNNIQSILTRSLAAAEKLDMKDQLAVVRELSELTAKIIQDLGDPLEKYPGTPARMEIVSLLPAATALTDIAAIVEEAEKRLPPLTPEQTAWDTLTRIEENVKAHEGAKTTKEQANELYRLSQILSLTFEQSRDATLSSLYKNIELRFTELYRAIHSEDEADFESQLRPDGAGLTLEVDFHHRGKFPPLAVHSEGHQDTMGFCLYLALAEKLNTGLIDLIVLDDVVMSVDSGHRRQICQLLKDKFPDKQFAITTHDKTWARQLEATGVVSRQNSIEFSNWTIDAGPLVAEADLWLKLDGDLKKEDVPSAAHRLRRGTEQFFELVCDNLQSMVTYKSSGRYELSDFADGAIGSYKKYLRQAKASAQSWGKKDDFEKLGELETVATQIITRSNVEKWAVNENVHYNRWGEFSKEDFIPVAEAFRDLLALFQCQDCNAALSTEFSTSKQATALRCSCGKVNWNLLVKK